MSAMQIKNNPDPMLDGPANAVRPRGARGIGKMFEVRVGVLAIAACVLVAVPPRAAPGQGAPATSPAPSDSGRTVVIKVVDPDGRPLTGVLAHHLAGFGSSSAGPEKSAELHAVKPPAGKTRAVWFVHEPRKLAGFLTLSGDSEGPYTAKLGPWAAVTGRVLGADKKPRDGLVLSLQVGKDPLMTDAENCAYWRGPIASDGSFRIEGIVPDLPSRALVVEPAISFAHTMSRPTFKPGETVDIGTFIVPKLKLPAGTKGVQPPPPRPLVTAKLDEAKARAEYRTDFRKGGYDFRWLKIDAPAGMARLVKPDKKGLRFTVPAGLGQGATVVTKFGVAGDFEITATFEAVSTERPVTGWGMGPELLIKPAGGWDKFASAGRFLRTDQKVYALVHGYKVGDKPKIDAATHVTDFKEGRFRLVRTGPTLHFQVAEGTNPAFRELFATEFGTEPLEFVRLAAVTGGSQKAVEVLWKDLAVRAEELPGFTGPAPRPSSPFGGLLWVAVGIVAVAGLAALVWLRAAAKKPGTPSGGDGPTPHKSKPVPTDAWDEATLATMEEAAASYAQAHPEDAACGHRARFQFTLHQGRLHGPFIAWKPIDREELEKLGPSWDEVRAKLPVLFQGTYHRGKRQGTFTYHDDQGGVSTRRYQDGRVAG
jgi:hypothetical protein